MRRAVLISREPGEGLALAARLAEAGDEVRVVLLDAAVTVTRAGHPERRALAAAADAGVAVSAHDEALAERAIPAPEAFAVVGLEEVADLVTDGADRVVWT